METWGARRPRAVQHTEAGPEVGDLMELKKQGRFRDLMGEAVKATEPFKGTREKMRSQVRNLRKQMVLANKNPPNSGNPDELLGVLGERLEAGEDMGAQIRNGSDILFKEDKFHLAMLLNRIGAFNDEFKGGMLVYNMGYEVPEIPSSMEKNMGFLRSEPLLPVGLYLMVRESDQLSRLVEKGEPVNLVSVTQTIANNMTRMEEMGTKYDFRVVTSKEGKQVAAPLPSENACPSIQGIIDENGDADTIELNIAKIAHGEGQEKPKKRILINRTGSKELLIATVDPGQPNQFKPADLSDHRLFKGIIQGI
ncbi:hypothetical protein ACFLRC_01995 [Candidatus Altiarchaeota archaeon]